MSILNMLYNLIVTKNHVCIYIIIFEYHFIIINVIPMLINLISR